MLFCIGASALSGTEYGVCNFKKKTSQEGRGEKRLCECVFLCVPWLFAEVTCDRSAFLGCKDHI